MPVVLFHLGVAGFSGGFVGVDVFFVISGFLITRIIIDDIDGKRFSIWNFYERRIRRIFPALFTVLIVSGFFAFALFLPDEYEDFSDSLIATVLFVSNILFWSESGYFDAPAELKPLLHTWSLAVEEQFYLLFPPFLLLIYRYGRHWPLAILLTALLSLLLSIWGTWTYPVSAFYLTPFRAWELALGSLLAANVLPVVRNPVLCDLLGICGLGAILFAVSMFSSETPFPGASALVPCIGAALLIHSGAAAPNTYILRLLSLRPIVFVGLISYSLYLWHWPVIVFAKYWHIEALDDFAAIVIVGLSLGLAIISWRFIETPFRKKAIVAKRVRLFQISGGAMTALVLFGIAGTVSEGLPWRMEPNVLSYLEKSQYLHDMRKCHQVSKRKQRAKCVRGAKDLQPDFVLVGDSHADAVSPAIFSAAAQSGRSGIQFTDTGYRPLFGFKQIKNRRRDLKLDSDLQSLLSASNIKDVYLQLYWSDVFRKRYYDDNGRLVSGSHAVVEGLSNLFKKYPGVTFHLIEDNPVGPGLSPSTIARALHVHSPRPTGSGRAAYEQQLAATARIFDEFADNPNVTVISMADVLCSESYCSNSENGKLIYRDGNHLSLYGAMKLENLFLKSMTKAEGL